MMPDWILTAWLQIKPLLTPLGGIGAIIIAISGLLSAAISKWFVYGSIEKKKSALGRETERLKGTLNQELVKLTASLTRDTNSELERLRSILGRESDTFRLKLKKQELLFDKELTATREFMKLNHSIWPTYSNPGIEWEEATTKAAQDLSKTEKLLADFIVTHGAFLGDEALADLVTLRETASIYKFAFQENDQEVATATVKGGELLMKLKDIEKHLLYRLRN
jgi:hypothetical protein